MKWKWPKDKWSGDILCPAFRLFKQTIFASSVFFNEGETVVHRESQQTSNLKWAEMLVCFPDKQHDEGIIRSPAVCWESSCCSSSPPELISAWSGFHSVCLQTNCSRPEPVRPPACCHVWSALISLWAPRPAARSVTHWTTDPGVPLRSLALRRRATFCVSLKSVCVFMWLFFLTLWAISHSLLLCLFCVSLYFLYLCWHFVFLWLFTVCTSLMYLCLFCVSL